MGGLFVALAGSFSQSGNPPRSLLCPGAAVPATTTVLFALMMRATDKEIAGTHYTLLARLEVWGKLPLGALSGVVAANAGYGGVFGIATFLCVAFAVLVAAVRGRLASAAA